MKVKIFQGDAFFVEKSFNGFFESMQVEIIKSDVSIIVRDKEPSYSNPALNELITTLTVFYKEYGTTNSFRIES